MRTLIKITKLNNANNVWKCELYMIYLPMRRKNIFVTIDFVACTFVLCTLSGGKAKWTLTSQ